jgi:hypothetical protein
MALLIRNVTAPKRKSNTPVDTSTLKWAIELNKGEALVSISYLENGKLQSKDTLLRALNESRSIAIGFDQIAEMPLIGVSSAIVSIDLINEEGRAIKRVFENPLVRSAIGNYPTTSQELYELRQRSFGPDTARILGKEDATIPLRG